MNWQDIVHFQPHEFDSPDQPGSGKERMDLTLVKILDEIRETIDRPLHITSGYRSYAHNKRVGGVPGSAHLYGKAADIDTKGDWSFVFALVQAAMAYDVKRIGISLKAKFVHLDIDDDRLPAPRIWFYDAASSQDS